MKKRIVVWLVIMLICLAMCANAEESVAQVLVRGRTAVIRVDRSRIQNYVDADNWHFPQTEDSFQIERIDINDAWLRVNLEDAEYNAFMEDYNADGHAFYAKVRDIDCFNNTYDRDNRLTPQFDRLIMNERETSDGWYIVFHQNQTFKSTGTSRYGIELVGACCFAAEKIVAQSGAESEFSAYIYRGKWLPDDLISITPYDGGASEQIQRGDISFEIFAGLDTHIAVITKSASEKTFVESAVLKIGNIASVNVTGYLDSNRAVYCCVLLDSEWKALVDGANAYMIQ